MKQNNFFKEYKFEIYAVTAIILTIIAITIDKIAQITFADNLMLSDWIFSLEITILAIIAFVLLIIACYLSGKAYAMISWYWLGRTAAYICFIGGFVHIGLWTIVWIKNSAFIDTIWNMIESTT